MKTLAERMLEAADTLEEVSRIYGFGGNATRAIIWSPDTLRHESQHVEGHAE